jgi:hypothetical protein
LWINDSIEQLVVKAAVILVAILSGGFFFVSTCAADPLFYAVTSQNDLGTFDPLTGNFAYLSKVSLPGGDNIDGIGFAANGNLYGFDGNFLYQFNTNNGAVTQTIFPKPSFGTNVVRGNGFGMTGSPNGSLFAYGLQNVNSSTWLYTVNPSNAEATFIGNMANGFGGGLAFNTAGDLYITKAYGTEKLYSINPDTAAITFIGNTGTPDSLAMAFENNTLYMADVVGGIWTVNMATGSATRISTYNNSLYGLILGLASPDLLAVPEPSTPMLVGLGGLALLAWRRK